MVALNTDYAPSKTSTRSQNRVGDFFCEAGQGAEENRLASRIGTKEKTSYSYETASGLPVWPSRDPLDELGFGVGNYDTLDVDGFILPEYDFAGNYSNLLIFLGNDSVNGYEMLGLYPAEAPTPTGACDAPNSWKIKSLVWDSTEIPGYKKCLKSIFGLCVKSEWVSSQCYYKETAFWECECGGDIQKTDTTSAVKHVNSPCFVFG